MKRMREKGLEFSSWQKLKKQKESGRSRSLNKNLQDSELKDKQLRKRVFLESKDNLKKKRLKGTDLRSKQRKKLHNCLQDWRQLKVKRQKDSERRELLNMSSNSKLKRSRNSWTKRLQAGWNRKCKQILVATWCQPCSLRAYRLLGNQLLLSLWL